MRLIFLALTLLMAGSSGQRATFIAQNTPHGGGNPCLPFTDNFVQPDNTFLTYSPWTQSPSTGFWVQSHTLVQNTTGTSLSAWIASCSGYGASQYAQLSFTVVDSYVWLSVQTTSTSSAYYVVCVPAGSGTCQAQNGGTGLGGFSFGLTDGVATTLCLEVDSGTTLRLKVNGTYDPANYSVSGLSGGVPGFGGLVTTSFAATQFKSGNGVCP